MPRTNQSWMVPSNLRPRQILQQARKGQRDCEELKKVLKKLGIPVGKKNGGFTLHSLRASFKTICIHARIPREVVDEWQNHAGRRPTASDA